MMGASRSVNVHCTFSHKVMIMMVTSHLIDSNVLLPLIKAMSDDISL